MMDLFILQITLSFIIGVLWITSLSFFAEKLGSKLGGAIAGIPATMVIALFFMGLTQNPLIASQSTTVIPLILGVNALFVLVYIYCSKYGLIKSLGISLLFWFIAAAITKILGFDSFIQSILIFLVILSFTYYVLEKKLIINSLQKVKVNYSHNQMLLRGIIAGLVIAFSIVMAKFGGPLLGGIFATFPALTVALIILVHLNQGRIFTIALLKNFIISGTINVLVFILAVRYTYPTLGIILGTIISFLISLIVTYINYNLINKKLR